MSTPQYPGPQDPSQFPQQPFPGQPPFQGQTYPGQPYGQQQPFPQQPFPQQPQPPGKPPRTGRRNGCIAVVAIVLLGIGAIGVIVAALGGSSKPKHPAAVAPTTAAPVSTPTSHAPAPPTKVEFVVTGSAPSGADITYGSDSDNRTVSGHLGVLGTGAAVPWHGSVKFDGSALYYVVNAQLDGGGNIKCKIVVTGPGDQPLTVATGHASGGYSICSAQAAPTDSSGLSWQKE